ncbi:MAG: DUF4396 domain-containing protein [Rhodospirillum sp.]|nr:DUF4396 domain-containing protein [Rhodospirillum sp.]MCF8487574.1 DUF4396 domain-containing protein [Rhodospirillum sp.]MCF8499057.1 DUF4396 domain-containing protein [Rhodospirillum sp.]
MYLELLRAALGQPWLLAIWLGSVAIALVVAAHDLTRGPGRHLAGMMRVVWGLTILYSGILGLALYWWSGRPTITRDDPWRRAGRSVAHCYSGCGLGEMTGVILAVGVFSLGSWGTAGLTFALAYLFGVALTVGPMTQTGVPLATALKDAIAAETPSIATMEAVAISTDLAFAGSAGPSHILYWTSLLTSLSLGLLAAWPVNRLLIGLGVKEGMHDPRHAIMKGGKKEGVIQEG